jgi:hypothetical protein
MWAHLERYLARLDDLRRFLDVSEAISKQESIKWAQSTAEARSAAIVCAMAELESLLSGTLSAVNAAINDSGVAVGKVAPSLRPLAAHKALLSLAALGDPDKIWPQRQFVTTLEVCVDPVDLPVVTPASREPLPPLDGRTLKPAHIQRVAAVYGVELNRLIRTADTLSLKKLSECRNDIAHGNVPFSALFSRKGFLVDEIREDLLAFDEIGYRLVDTFDQYVSRQEYLV